MNDESDRSPGTDDMIRRIDARLAAAEVGQPPAASPDVEPDDDAAPTPVDPDEQPSPPASSDATVLVELTNVLRHLDDRILHLAAKVDGLATSPPPEEQVPQVPQVLLDRLDHLDAQVTALAQQAATVPPPVAAEPQSGPNEVQEELELLRNQLEHAFYEVDLRNASHLEELHKLSDAVTGCVEELGALRHSTRPDDAAGSSDIASGIERLEKGLHELSESTADLGLRTSLDIEQLQRALDASPQSAVDTTDVVRKVDEQSLHLAADIAGLRAEVADLVRALGAQEDAVRLLTETTGWIKQRLLR